MRPMWTLESEGSGGFYPEDQSPMRAQLEVRYRRFAELREALLLEYSRSTAIAYWGDLDSWMLWCLGHQVDALAPTTEDVARFLDEHRANGYSVNTIARRITALRAFFAYLVREGILEQTPMLGLHQRRPRPAPRQRSPRSRLTARQRQRLRAAAQHPRDKAVLELLLDQISVTQVCRAEVPDVVGTAGSAHLVTSFREIPEVRSLSPATVAAVRAYLAGRVDGPLIIDDHGRRVDRFDINRILNRLGRAAGLRTPVSARQLGQAASRSPRISRHTSSTDR